MIALFALTAGLAGLGLSLLPAQLRLLVRHGFTSPNYAGEVIPVGTGALVALLTVAMYAAVELGYGLALTATEAVMRMREGMPAFALVFAVGWLDDVYGDRTAKGFAGHWRRWRETGTPTTGVVKAAAIGLAALWMALRQSGSWGETAFDWLTIALAANALNLLDVRPGRTWKSYYLAVALLLAAHPAWSRCLWLLPGAAAGIALLPGDLKGRHMLGDCGSNLLGFALGCALAAAPWWLQATALLVLAAMHRAAETSSISAWIERHKWVRWLDRFGRV